MNLSNEAIEWLANGDRGLSSNSMVSVIVGVECNKSGWSGIYHPSDPSDFDRCYKLLCAVPEIKENLHRMKQASEVWANIVDNWDELAMMLIDMKERRKQGIKPVANGMYEFMKELGC